MQQIQDLLLEQQQLQVQQGHRLRFCLALGLQRLLLAQPLAPVSHQHLAQAQAPASQVLQVLDRCRQRCFLLALTLLLLPLAR